MNDGDRAAFGDAVDRLRDAGMSLDPTTRSLWTMVRVVDVVARVAALLVAGMLGLACAAVFAGPQSIIGLVGGSVTPWLLFSSVRRRVLAAVCGRLAQRLDMPQLGAVGGATSAALPSAFIPTKQKLAPPTTTYPTIVRPQRVGDDDALDFDDND